MSDKINLHNSRQLHARRFTATINNNGSFILQPPLKYQIVAQNIATDDLTNNQQSNIGHSEPQIGRLSHVVRRIADSDDAVTASQ